jgi:hypothetical protein
LPSLSETEKALRQKLKDDFEHYASRCIRIRTKSGAIEPLVLNRAQLYLHQRIQEQKAKTGKVRAIILKGRQQGCSTYVGARFYWRVTHRRGVRVFILTHEQEATNNLFEMVNRFHEHCPAPVRPATSASNAKELVFEALDSGYKVGTAGTKGVGRSSTLQLFHGSEVAFWPFAETHAAGVLQAVPDEPDTEVVLESTANGLGNYYHQQWQKAEARQSDYQAIFIPWFWQPEYRKPANDSQTLSVEENEYRDLYDLDAEQMAWRRAKIAELKDDWLFRQEYPATPSEAFQSSGDDVYIPPILVMKARKANASPHGAKVGGCDPARFGDDRTSFALRQGRKVHLLQSHSGKDTMEVAGLCVRFIKDHGLTKLFVDVGGLGAGVVDRLNEMGYRDKIHAVNSGEKPLDDTRYVNKRAEMWGEMKDWLAGQPAQIPDSDTLHADLTGPLYTYDSNQRLKLERKEDMKKRGLRSPDEGDALALTFAFPVGESNKAWATQPSTKWVV